MDIKEYKPQAKAFILLPFLRLTIPLIIAGIVVSISILTVAEGFPVIIPLKWVLIFAIIIISVLKRIRRFKKEKYIFQKTKIVKKSGTYLMDSETELNVKNITNVKLILPYVENKIFGTGHIYVQSAGSGAVEVSQISIEEPHKRYDEIFELMKDNGFSLKKEKVVQKETPSAVGAMKEVIGGAIATVVGLFFVIQFFAIGTFVINILQEIGHSMFFLFITIVALTIFFMSIIIGFTIRFLDLYMRVYTLYPDTITYYEGFLTRKYSFIPVENLADVATTRDLIDRIIGLYDLRISCQGSGQELLFKNVINGKLMEKNVYSLIKGTTSLEHKASIEKQKAKKEQMQDEILPQQEDVATKKATESRKSRKTSSSSHVESSHVMDPLKSLYWVLLLFIALFISAIILFIISPIIMLTLIFAVVMIIGALANALVSVFFTKYNVKENSVEEQFAFIAARQTEFSFDKITGVVIKESLIDRIFNTFTIKFWSIGSSQNIVFKNIKKDQGLLKSIIKKGGFQNREVLYKVKPEFGFRQAFMANLPLVFVMFIFPPFGLIVLPFIIPGYIYKGHYHRRCNLVFYKEHVEKNEGIFIRTRYLSRYDDVKGVTIRRYPKTDIGYIQFNIAGEEIKAENTKNQTLISNAFGIKYAPDIRNKKHLVDAIILNQPEPEMVKFIEDSHYKNNFETKRISRPDIANSATIIILFTPILLILMPIILAFVIWKIKVTSYHIENSRVLERKGIIYRTQTSVLFNKIDHINSYRGFFNKIYSNGKISINTTGSSGVEMEIKNISDYLEFYKELQKEYKS